MSERLFFVGLDKGRRDERVGEDCDRLWEGRGCIVVQGDDLGNRGLR